MCFLLSNSGELFFRLTIIDVVYSRTEKNSAAIPTAPGVACTWTSGDATVRKTVGPVRISKNKYKYYEMLKIKLI